ncbi:sulfurtransferase TusA family protein [Kaistia dalseonensis]|uniref:tRNA 2-thiouridine synthesizing protein A n=1 Tax=Kaistia dalseonensis TaxID=410840 RepID=A0ABU0H4C2_9HYPH|nr:sulfurtransferase TusA family protein [Kaistia dalseonensis]MCX5494567.1 sulfurtransferase TusA family protein [Kaistia dalseonensis]MDQ0437147.1 tRNA 2-thiouridine synthesizing protein A [Kaistia dalseonensis]
MDQGNTIVGSHAPSPDDRRLDAIGLACPLPVLKARKMLAQMAPGARLLVEATDPMAAIDIPHLCHEDGHILVNQDRSAPPILRFLIERGTDRAESASERRLDRDPL